MRKPKQRQMPLCVKVQADGIFVEYDSVMIAKRGRPGTSQEGTWVSIEPGWTVTDSSDRREIIVNYEKPEVH